MIDNSLQFSKEEFINQYNNLRSSNVNANGKQIANVYLMNFQKSPEAWGVCKQLLDTPDAQIQFTGSHILLMKVKQNFLSLEGEPFNELRAFLFDQVENRTDFIVVTLQTLCSAISALAIYGIGYGQWETVITDLIPFMQKGEKQLWIGLQIMQSLQENFRDMIIGRNAQSKVKSTLLSHSNSVIDIFNSLLQLEDSGIVKKSLECLESWGEFEMNMLTNAQLVTNLVKQGNNFGFLVCEILMKLIKNSESSDLLARNQLTGTNDTMPQIERQNVEMIILFLQQFPPSIHSSELLITLLSTFSFLLLENIEMFDGLTKMYLQNLSSSDLKVSASCIPFLMNWSHVLKQYCRDRMEQRWAFIFLQAIQIMLLTCKKKRVDKVAREQKAVIVIDLESGEETHVPKKTGETDSEDDDINQNDKKMSLHDYRESCSEGIYECFRAIRDLQGQNGINSVYELILGYLDPQSVAEIQDENKRFIQYCIQTEASIFIAKQFIELESVQNENLNVDRILQFIAAQLPKSEATIQTALQYIYDASHEFKYSPHLFHPIIQFILSQFQSSSLSQQAAECLKSIMELSESHSHLESLQLTSQFFVTAFANQELVSYSTLDSLIQAVLVFIVKLIDQESRQAAFVNYLSLFRQYILTQQTLLHSQNFKREQLERTLDILISLFRGFDLLDGKHMKANQNVIIEFCDTNLSIINTMYKQFGTLRFKAFFERFITLYNLIIRACASNIPNSFLDFLNISLEIFSQNPLKYYSSVKLLNKLVMEVPSTNAYLANWLQNNYKQLNDSIRNFIKAQPGNQDIDLMTNYFALSKNVHLFHEKLFFESSFEETLDFTLTCLTTIENFQMTREILGFLMKLVEKGKGVDYGKILGAIVKAINLLQRVQINFMAAIFIQSVIKINNDQTLLMIIQNNLLIPELNQEDILFIAQSILLAAKTNILAKVKQVLGSLYALTSGQSNMEGFRFEISLTNR